MPSGPREIEITIPQPRESPEQRRAHENIEAYRSLVLIELSRCNPRAVSGYLDVAFISKNSEFIDVAMTIPHVSALARTMISQIARCVDKKSGGDDFVSPGELAAGIDDVDLAGLSLYVLQC